MKGIVHIRIDDRLIHGQVAVFWTNYFKSTRIMVINDEVAKDEMQKSVLRMVAPPNVRTSIISKETAVKNISEESYEGQRVLIIVKRPSDIVDLINMGLDIKSINVGNMAHRVGTKQIKKSVFVLEEDVIAFKKLVSLGVEITAIMVPDETKIGIMEYINKAGL